MKRFAHYPFTLISVSPSSCRRLVPHIRMVAPSNPSSLRVTLTPTPRARTPGPRPACPAGAERLGRRGRAREWQHAGCRHTAALRCTTGPAEGAGLRARTGGEPHHAAESVRRRASGPGTTCRRAGFPSPDTPATAKYFPAASARRARSSTRSVTSAFSRRHGRGPSHFRRRRSRYYNGFTQAQVKPTPDAPLQKLGVDKAVPIVTSAVMLDASAYRGRRLDAGELVTASRHRGHAERAGPAAPRHPAWRRGLRAHRLGRGCGAIPRRTRRSPSTTRRGPASSLDAQEYLARAPSCWWRSTIRSPIRCRRRRLRHAAGSSRSACITTT